MRAHQRRVGLNRERIAAVAEGAVLDRNLLAVRRAIHVDAPIIGDRLRQGVDGALDGGKVPPAPEEYILGRVAGGVG